jgi:lipopolysaccharide heptosyltransferase II
LLQGDFKNILVHSLIQVGDAIFSTPAVGLLRKAYPNAKITMMVKPIAAELMQNHPVIDEVIVFDYRPKHLGLGKMIKFLRDIRARKFDLCISLDGKPRPAIIAWLAGIPIRIGPTELLGTKNRSPRLFTHLYSVPDFNKVHQAEVLQALVRQLSGVEGSSRPSISRIADANMAKAESLLAKLPAGRHNIAFCVKGTFPLKNWPKERFAALMDRLAAEYDAALFIIGAPGDKSYADDVIKLASTPVANFCGETSLMDLAALLERADLLVSCDTGAAHIAATTRVPIVVMYGCGEPYGFHPLTETRTTLSKDFPCKPCSYPADGCPHDHMCMNAISVDEVFEAAAQYLVKP